jgi:hypothetical protein
MLELSLPLPNRCGPCSRATGTKRALKPVQVWGIRIRLQVHQRLPDLALFDLALDSKLRGCDLVSLRCPTSLPTSGAQPSHDPPAEDRPAGAVRDNGANPTLHRSVD